MSQTFYLIIAIFVIISLVVLFFVTYILNKRTAIPEGCEKMPTEHCSGCINKHCEYYQKEEK